MMTEKEWKKRCADKIIRAVEKAGRLSIRELCRATSYNRGPENCIAWWYQTLEDLELRKRVFVEHPDGLEQVLSVMTLATAARLIGAGKL